MAAAPTAFLLHLLAEVHDCHLMGALNSSGASTELCCLHPSSLILPPSCPFGMRILVRLSPLGAGMSCLLLFQKIEILDDEESDLISNSEVDQMSSLLDYKVSDEAMGQWDNPQGVQGVDLSGILQQNLWDAEFLCCAHHALIPPQPLYPCLTQIEARKPHFYRAAAPPMCPNKGIYGATPELFLGMLQHFPWCCQLGKGLSWNPLLEWGDLRRNHSPGMGQWWLWEGGEAAGSCQLLVPAKGWGCVCAALPGVATIPHFLEFLPPVLIFFPLETRSVLLTVINYQNNKQTISSEQKFLLPAAFSWEGQWRMNQEREWPFLNVTCQQSERLVVTVPCRASLVVWQHWLLNLNSSWAGQNPELNRQLLSIHREEFSWFFMEASELQPKYSSLIPRAVITWNSVVSSAFTEKCEFSGEKGNKNASIFKDLLQTFRASCSQSFSCLLKLNSCQCEHGYNIFFIILSWVGVIKQSPSTKNEQCLWSCNLNSLIFMIFAKVNNQRKLLGALHWSTGLAFWSNKFEREDILEINRNTCQIWIFNWEICRYGLGNAFLAKAHKLLIFPHFVMYYIQFQP